MNSFIDITIFFLRFDFLIIGLVRATLEATKCSAHRSVMEKSESLGALGCGILLSRSMDKQVFLGAYLII